MRDALGSLDRVDYIVKLLGMVNAVPDFNDSPKVINGCSDLFVEVFGDAGRHARSAVGNVMLPNQISVEIEGIVAVKPKCRVRRCRIDLCTQLSTECIVNEYGHQTHKVNFDCSNQTRTMTMQKRRFHGRFWLSHVGTATQVRTTVSRANGSPWRSVGRRISSNSSIAAAGGTISPGAELDPKCAEPRCLRDQWAQDRGLAARDEEVPAEELAVDRGS